MSNLFVDRWLPLPIQSFFLFGPRGTGKSTFLQARYPGALRLDFLNPSVDVLIAAAQSAYMIC